MTTVAASLQFGMMAADSRGVFYTLGGEQIHAYQCMKLVRLDGWIVGCAGDQEDIDEFMRWLPDRRKKRKKVRDDFAALLLSRKKLMHVTDNTLPDEARGGCMAIGSGGGFALAAMNTMGRISYPPDPRIAVAVACDLDPGTAAPIDFLTWRA